MCGEKGGVCVHACMCMSVCVCVPSCRTHGDSYLQFLSLPNGHALTQDEEVYGRV